MTTHLDVESVGEWYTYEFHTAEGVPCGLPGCTLTHPFVYFGKSNEPWRRHFEHLDKPWLPSTSGYRIHPGQYATEAEALAAEAALIRGAGRDDPNRPLANDLLNRDNRHRLVFPKTTPGRAPARRQVTPSRPYVPATRSLPAPSRWQVVTGTWAALSAAGWWAATTYAGLVGWSAPLAGSLAAAVLMATAALTVVEVRAWWKSRRARRQRRQLALTLAALTVCAAVAGLLYLLSPILLAHVPTQAAPH